MSDDGTYRVQLDLNRSPLYELDPLDVEAVRAFMLRNAETNLVLKGGLVPQLIYLGPGVVERGSLQRIEELGKETIVALLFRQAADREGILRAFREGEMFVEVEGATRRAAVVLERVQGSERWWLAWRLFGQGEAGVGVFHGDWRLSEGDGVDALPQPFREWIDTGTASMESQGVREMGPGPVDDIRMAVAVVEGTLPTHPCEVAAVLGQITDAELLAKPLGYVLVFAFRPETLERWELRGRLRVPLDDLVRAIAAQGPVEALAVVHPAVVEMNGVSHRCVSTVVERGGRRGRRLVPFRMKDGKLVASEPLFQEDGEVGPEGMWIGVAPRVVVDLTVLGAVDVDGPEVPEA